MITEEQILQLGFEHKSYNKFTDTDDYRHKDYSFLICLSNNQVQIINAKNKNEGPSFINFNELQNWLEKQ